ncbi:CheB methylesterase domain-containing protein [Ponticoccus alexandrii]|uniref:protein-glutamate methylesterase n=1 Tax=Ponticoccus alexandrii TaxID=1943633 RepID=A0ABX7F9P8_9RHOB|nr:CheB methylesterase domain-containing protein [Ponticoccus alexandrii]QRF66940.1 chemotaxis protein CheB [Ponticoccus alexandrii]
MQTKSVVVATPDRRERARLCKLVDRMPEFSVIASAGDLMNTYNEVEDKLPKAVLIADVLADLPEFEVMRGLFSTLDIRWLVVATPNRPALRSSSLNRSSDLFAVSADASEADIARQLLSLTRTALSPRRPAKSPALQARYASLRSPGRETPTPDHPPRPLQPALSRHPPAPGSRQQVILIGSSTGGVDALLTVLSSFPSDCPPTLIVQHTGFGFGESLAGLLDRQCRARVHLASGAGRLAPGVVTIGAGIKAHLVIAPDCHVGFRLDEGDPVSGHIPSVDMLFRSAATLGGRISAALLTGMGRDGAEGLLALRKAGAATMAQDEASSVVYGMPRAAAELGAAQDILPLNRIGPALLRSTAGADAGAPRQEMIR